MGRSFFTGLIVGAAAGLFITLGIIKDHPVYCPTPGATPSVHATTKGTPAR